jgi:hypothetical protein
MAFPVDNRDYYIKCVVGGVDLYANMTMTAGGQFAFCGTTEKISTVYSL